MPIYEYLCKRCNKKVELLIQGNTTPECPTCSSKDLEKQFSVFSASSSNNSASANNNQCQSCEGPGKGCPYK